MADIKRMNYFDQQFLLVGDFVAEQNYHRDMRLLHNKTFHTYGVASGLDVSLSGPGEVTVSAGMAIDKDGQEIVLAENTPHTLTNDPASGPLLIVIKYLPVESDLSPFLPGMHTRIKEDNQIIDIHETSLDTEGVVLARVTKDAQGNITVDTSVRRWVGPLNDDTSEVAIALGRLRLGGKSIPNSQWPSLTASGPNEVTVGGSLKVSGDARVTGNITAGGRVGIGADAPGAKLHVVGDCIRMEATDRSKRVELRVDGFAGWLTSPTSDLFITCDAPGGPNRIILNPWSNNGNVGIGTADPKAKLHVVGSVKCSMWNVTQVYDSTPGPLKTGATNRLTKDITTGGGTLVIFASGSGWAAARTPFTFETIGMDVRIDQGNNNLATVSLRTTTNEPVSHRSFVANARVVTGIDAGTYKLTLVPFASTVTDSLDFFSVAIFEMPW